MDIKSLPHEVRNHLRSGININSPSQCVTELILNSLDAKSTAIAVRVNLITHRIQVVDNGQGISKFNMNFVGVRYMTNKCQSLRDLKHHTHYYGFRGESLASIVGVSEKVMITSKCSDVDNTYSKCFENGTAGDVQQVKIRPEHGGTVTVENFLYNLPIRQKNVKPDVDLENVKVNVEHLAIIHPNVSFSLRNDVNGKIVLKVNKTSSVAEAFVALYSHISSEDLLKFDISKHNLSISGLVHKKSYVNKNLQLLYVNKRPVSCNKIQKLISKLYTKCLKSKKKQVDLVFEKHEYPVYVLNIRCPYTEIDIILHPSKTNVMFKKLDTLLVCIEKAFCKFWGVEYKPKTIAKPEHKSHDSKANQNFLISEMKGAIKGIPAKRKLKTENLGESNKKQIKLGDTSSNFFVKPKHKRKFVLSDKQSNETLKKKLKPQPESCSNKLSGQERLVNKKKFSMRLRKRPTRNKPFITSSAKNSTNSCNDFTETCDKNANRQDKKLRCSEKIGSAHRTQVFVNMWENNLLRDREFEQTDNYLQDDAYHFMQPENNEPKTKLKFPIGKSNNDYVTTKQNGEYEKNVNYLEDDSYAFMHPENNLPKNKLKFPIGKLKNDNDSTKQNRAYEKNFNYLEEDSNAFVRPENNEPKNKLNFPIGKSRNISISTKQKREYEKNFNYLKEDSYAFMQPEHNEPKNKLKICARESTNCNVDAVNNREFAQICNYSKDDSWAFMQPESNNCKFPIEPHNHSYLQNREFNPNCNNLQDDSYIMKLENDVSKNKFKLPKTKIGNNFHYKKYFIDSTAKQNDIFNKNCNLNNDCEQPTNFNNFNERNDCKQNLNNNEVNYSPSLFTEEKDEAKCNLHLSNNLDPNNTDISLRQLCPNVDLTKSETFGKKIIMDMYLKSTVAFADNFEKPDSLENMTIKTLQSNVLLEKMERSIVASKINHNATMTYSMKITTERMLTKGLFKTTKTKRPQVNIINQNHQNGCENKDILSNLTLTKIPKMKNLDFITRTKNEHVQSKCVQTSLNNIRYEGTRKNKMSSKCIQTSISNLKFKNNFNVSTVSKYFLNYKDDNHNHKYYKEKGNHHQPERCHNDYSNQCPKVDRLQHHVSGQYENIFEPDSFRYNETYWRHEPIFTNFNKWDARFASTNQNCNFYDFQDFYVKNSSFVPFNKNEQTRGIPIYSTKTNEKIKYRPPHKYDFFNANIYSKCRNNDFLPDYNTRCYNTTYCYQSNTWNSHNIKKRQDPYVPKRLFLNKCNCSKMNTNIFCHEYQCNQHDLKKDFLWPWTENENICFYDDTNNHLSRLPRNINTHSNSNFNLLNKKSKYECNENQNLFLPCKNNTDFWLWNFEKNNSPQDKNACNKCVVKKSTNLEPVASTALSLKNITLSTIPKVRSKKMKTLLKESCFKRKSAERLNESKFFEHPKKTFKILSNNMPYIDLEVGKQFVKNVSSEKCISKTIKVHEVENTVTTPRINYSDSVMKNSDIVEMTLTTHDQTKNTNVRKDSERGECNDLEDLIISINSDNKFPITKRKDISNIEQEPVFPTNPDIQELNKNNNFEWITKFDHLGSRFYVNPRTGMTTITLPKKEQNFVLKKRDELLPKGVSQTIKNISSVDKSLSPTSKKQLENVILESFKKELCTIKWQNYLKNNDYETFFNKMYEEKTKEFDSVIPKVNNRLRCEKRFSKNMFPNLEIVGQLDKKFLVVIEQSSNDLVLFDQHAVDERIKVEKLFAEYQDNNSDNMKYKTTFLPRKYKVHIEMSDQNLDLLKTNENIFLNVGMQLKLLKNSVEITAIPSCFWNKYKQSDSNMLDDIVKTLFYQLIESIRCNTHIQNTPDIMKHVINSEACRSAIKFGDELDFNDIENLLKDLRNCKLPFQCAHGRPTLSSVVNLGTPNTNVAQRKPNLSRLLNKKC